MMICDVEKHHLGIVYLYYSLQHAVFIFVVVLTLCAIHSPGEEPPGVGARRYAFY